MQPLPKTPIRPDDKNRGSAQSYRIWQRGKPVRQGDLTDRYLWHRGVGMDIYPPCLRTSKDEWYSNGGAVEFHSAMTAAVLNPDGKHVATHRTFLAPDGSGKANVPVQRKTVGAMGRNPQIRLTPAAASMGIAEGIETALSAIKLFGVPTWSVISATGIEWFDPPPGCRFLFVYADHDKHGKGQEAAEKLKARLAIPVEIIMPEKAGTDLNDVLLEPGP